ncbi:MAG TPA: glycosyltransferase family 39 protein [Candidatus Limnocylindria bacterium]|nr:glycosyltransferase family 39 protein [Candidatus Limnocylindria bacterium]
MTATTPVLTAPYAHVWRRPFVATATTFAALYGVALAIGFLVIALVRYPLSEGTSYYVDVAGNLVSGRGPVIDAIWSYGTPPLTLPRPAFELWQPMASFVAAVPMAIFGESFSAAQLGFVLMGATLAPLAWLVARDTVNRLALGARRSMTIELGAAVLTAISAPLLLATGAPDSTLPFTVFGVAACLFMPRAIAGDRKFLVALGVTLGLAYLTRMEAIWLGLAFVIGSLLAGRSVARTLSTSATVGTIVALVALPWWVRNVSVFGTPLPGQLTDNAFLTRNEQIFAYADQPTLSGFLAQGPLTILGNIVAAVWHDAFDVLVVSAGPIAIVGLLTLAAALLGRTQLPRHGPLAMLLLSGAITFVATSVLFPVATLWGTFEHAAGPLHIGLIVAAVVGVDAFVARVRAWRAWPRSNSWLAPAALALATLPIVSLALVGAAHAALTDARRIEGFVGVLPTDPGTIVTDRPIWLSRALGRSALALPDESIESIEKLVADFHAVAVIVTESRGDLPAALRTPEGQQCFGEVLGPAVPTGSAVFVVRLDCR